ncbi:MAG: MAPEG family protein [Leptolyngbya sp. BL-A-14]
MLSLPLLPVSTPTLLLYAIAAAAALIYLPFLVVAYGRLQAGYDMASPRALFDKLPDYAKRATWAHENAFESFVLFAAAALVAYVTGVQSPLAGWAAIAYVTARLFYPAFYILNVPVGRSLMFLTGSLSIATLFGLSLLTVQ